MLQSPYYIDFVAVCNMANISVALLISEVVFFFRINGQFDISYTFMHKLHFIHNLWNPQHGEHDKCNIIAALYYSHLSVHTCDVGASTQFLYNTFYQII